MSPTATERVGRSLRLWRLRVARAVELAPTSAVTALSAIAVLLAHRLSAGRGRGSLITARPVEERRPQEPAPRRPAAARPAA